jgi:hypothetical protein
VSLTAFGKVVHRCNLKISRRNHARPGWALFPMMAVLLQMREDMETSTEEKVLWRQGERIGFFQHKPGNNWIHQTLQEARKGKACGFFDALNFFHFFKFTYAYIHFFKFTYAYIIWVISSPCPPPSPSPPSPSQFQAGPVLPLSLVLLKKRDNLIRKTKCFC